MQKVLLIVSSLSGGGAEHVARKNLEILLHKKDFDVAVLTCDKALRDQYPVKHYLAKDFRKVRGPGKVFATMGIPENYKMTARCLQEFRPDIIHLHNYIPFSPSMLRALKEYKEKCGCKVILTHHTYSYICTNDSLYNYSQDKICEKCIGTFDTTIIRDNCANNRLVSLAKYLQKNEMSKFFADLVDVHISPSDFLKAELLKANPQIKVEVVRNPCVDRIEPDCLEAKENTVVFFGRISKEKNIVKFARQFMQIEIPLKLLIIGDGPEADELEALLKGADYNRIEFIHRFLKSDELYETIRTAKFYVLPSIWFENSPVSIIEAINLGMIPITSNIGGMKELIDLFGVGYTFDPMNDQEGAETLKTAYLQYESDVASLLQARSRLNQFTTQAYSRHILALYE
ncbi:glycosyltransferase [Harryflintia acetispora]|uniref:glycosyltransferase n=1 Tax=Harryflintia acetispora TaxID=1849041 RepID=UPI00104CA771|nr:glycosyltransferase [Harryflintia acetispora]